MNELNSSSKRIKRYKRVEQREKFQIRLSPIHIKTIMQTENWSGAEKKAFEEATIRHLRNDVEVTKLLIEQKLQDLDKNIFLLTYFMIKLIAYES